MPTKKSEPKTELKGMKGMHECCGHHWHARTKCGGGVYCMGFIGALVYYISTSTGFWNGLFGVLKALVWPAILVFKLLVFLG